MIEVKAARRRAGYAGAMKAKDRNRKAEGGPRRGAP